MSMNPRLLRPTASGFSPRSISGLALWLDASDSSALYTTDAGPVTAVSSPLDIAGCVGWYDSGDLSAMRQNSDGTGSVSTGDLVGYWLDKSPAGNHVAAPSTGKRPALTASAFNGRTALAFDGIDDTLMRESYSSQSGLSGLTRIAVVTQTASSATGPRSLSRDGGGGGFFILLNGSARFYADAASNAFAYPSQYTNYIIPPTVVASRLGSSAITVRESGLNQTVTTTGSPPATTAAASGRLSIGSNDNVNYWWQGVIAEYVIFNRSLSDTELARVEAYLAAKWGISGVHAPATATSDPVGAWLDKSGNGRHAVQATSGSRPTISATTTNGKRALAFNGSSSNLTISNYSGESGVAGLTRYMVMSITAPGGPMLTGTGGAGGTFLQTVSAQGRFFAGSAYSASDLGTSYALLTSGTRVVGSLYNGSAGSVASGILAYLDGASLSQVATSGTLPASLSGASSAYHLGSNIGANNFFNGRTLEVLTYNRALSAADRQRVERYLAAKYGITLAPQVSNADAQDWINRVYSNGGSVTSSTAAAVNTLCDSLDAASLRDRFYRLNLFCGTGLNAALVPLYRGPSLGGTQYGGTTDTNVGPFVSGDYAETGASGGLVGNGSSKYLNTGLTTAALPQLATGHLSAYAMTGFSAASAYGLVTSFNSGFDGSNFYGMEANAGNAAGVLSGGIGGTFAGRAQASAGVGLVSASRTSGTDLRLYRNGSQVGSTLTTSATAAANGGGGFAVFASMAASGSALAFAPIRMGAYSIGAGLDATQAAAYYTAMQAFQTALTRNV